MPQHARWWREPVEGPQHDRSRLGPASREPKGDVERETMVLDEVRHLGPAELAEARALQLDRRAYRVAPAVWGSTAPAERL